MMFLIAAFYAAIIFCGYTQLLMALLRFIVIKFLVLNDLV